MLIAPESNYLFVSNFSDQVVKIRAGQSLGIAYDPKKHLEGLSELNESEKEMRLNYCNYLHKLINSNNTAIDYFSTSKVKDLHDASIRPMGEANFFNEPPLENGPKTAETPEDPITSAELFKEIDISRELSEGEVVRLKEILWSNKEVFGLNGQLGNYPGEVEVPMVDGTKPISIPPFGASPEKRQVIDKQMDSWLQLGVIEPSKSPWAAPVFIVYRNQKPRMVIDLRRLNEKVIPDEFPLPRQEDILQTLQGSQYLSTLDALAGFTQLSVKAEDREKLAFRTHRGLYQFKRMPFGFCNGPAVFQRIMQGVLAPFLWIFALVYIDDIVIFSKTFDEHLLHVESVLKAILDSKITLSPSKCHFGYQSLLLLGQKVS